MGFGKHTIDGKLLSDLWGYKRPEYLTKGQLSFMIQEINRQKNGEGTDKTNYNYNDYWDSFKFPGEEVIIQK